MRTGIIVKVTPADRRKLETIIASRSMPQKHVWRAKIILATADGCGTAEIMRRSGKSKSAVWRWQARFMAEGVEGLLRDKTRKPGKPPLTAATVRRVVDLMLGPPPGGGAKRWTGRMLAQATGVSLRSVQRIVEAHQLAPNQIRTFKLSSEAIFTDERANVVGLYVDPPGHAIVLSRNGRTRNQVRDRNPPGSPIQLGHAGTMSRDDRRDGVTTLFAALNILDGNLNGRGRRRHRHLAFVRFLDAIEAQASGRKAFHAVLDNAAAHKHPKVREWLTQHPRWTFHFTPNLPRWQGAVEGLLLKLTRRRLPRGIFRAMDDLREALGRFVTASNGSPKPFVWTADRKRAPAVARHGEATS
jgi:hypothetical protein